VLSQGHSAANAELTAFSTTTTSDRPCSFRFQPTSPKSRNDRPKLVLLLGSPFSASAPPAASAQRQARRAPCAGWGDLIGAEGQGDHGPTGHLISRQAEGGLEREGGLDHDCTRHQAHAGDAPCPQAPSPARAAGRRPSLPAITRLGPHNWRRRARHRRPRRGRARRDRPHGRCARPAQRRCAAAQALSGRSTRAVSSRAASAVAA
jgi:hypothetical protein